jgi:hypothetical protein
MDFHPAVSSCWSRGSAHAVGRCSRPTPPSHAASASPRGAACSVAAAKEWWRGSRTASDVVDEHAAARVVARAVRRLVAARLEVPSRRRALVSPTLGWCPSLRGCASSTRVGSWSLPPRCAAAAWRLPRRAVWRASSAAPGGRTRRCSPTVPPSWRGAAHRARMGRALSLPNDVTDDWTPCLGRPALVALQLQGIAPDPFAEL